MIFLVQRERLEKVELEVFSRGDVNLHKHGNGARSIHAAVFGRAASARLPIAA
jgi:hypothetical protein